MKNSEFDYQRYEHEFSKERYYAEKYGEDMAKDMMEFDEACDKIDKALDEINLIAKNLNNYLKKY